MMGELYMDKANMRRLLFASMAEVVAGIGGRNAYESMI